MKNKKFLFVALLSAIILSNLTEITNAISVNADDISINVYTEQGNEWFRALKEKTNSKGVLELDKLLPAKYRLEIDDDDDKKVPQAIDVGAQMYDEEGRKFKDKVDVTAYIFINVSALPVIVKGNDKVLVGVFETDSDGVVKLPGILPDFNYEVRVDKTASLSKKANRQN